MHGAADCLTWKRTQGQSAVLCDRTRLLPRGCGLSVSFAARTGKHEGMMSQITVNGVSTAYTALAFRFPFCEDFMRRVESGQFEGGERT